MTTQALILAAGAGKRFRDAGYLDPKPLIPLDDVRPMIAHVFDDLKREFGVEAVTIVCQNADLDRILDEVQEWDCPSVLVRDVPALTEGAAASALIAESTFEPDQPLIVINSDQKFHFRAPDTGRSLIESMRVGAIDGAIPTFDSKETKWSYVSLDKQWSGMVARVEEKPLFPPSNQATVGCYVFKTASMAFDAVRAMVAANDRVNGEFYFAPCYNHLPRATKILAVPVGEMIGLGTPADLERYLWRKGGVRE
jgi:dTDP-glucose pyrophosphorylase